MQASRRIGTVTEPRKITTRKGGTSYQFRYVGLDGVQRAVNRPTLTEAVMAAEDTRRSLAAGTDPKRADARVSDVIAEYVEHLESDPERARRQKSVLVNLRLHVGPYWGRMVMRDITPPATERWIRDVLCCAVSRKGAPLSPDSIRNIYGSLSVFMTWATREGIVSFNPCTAARSEALPKKPHAIRKLSEAQMAALCDALPERYRLMLRVAAFAGLRDGEVRGLRWDDIDAKYHRITVRQQMVSGGDRTPPKFGPPKARTVDDEPEEVHVHPELIAALIDYKVTFAVDNPWNLVFTTPQGQPLARDKFNRIWRLARTRAGQPNVRFHDARHFAVSTMLADRSVSITEAAANARHRDGGQLMQKVYAHVLGDDRTKAAAALRPSF